MTNKEWDELIADAKRIREEDEKAIDCQQLPSVQELRDLRTANEALRKRVAELERIPSRIRDWYYGRNKTVNADSLVDIVAASDALLASSPATPEGGER